MRQWIDLFENDEPMSDFMSHVRGFNEGEGGWMDRDPQGRYVFSTEYYHFSLHQQGDVVEIANIDVMQEHRQNGHGAMVMKKLCALADKFRIKLILVADETNDTVEDNSYDTEDYDGYDEEHWLQNWYSSLGFDYTGDVSDYGPWMERNPS